MAVSFGKDGIHIESDTDLNLLSPLVTRCRILSFACFDLFVLIVTAVQLGLKVVRTGVPELVMSVTVSAAG